MQQSFDTKPAARIDLLGSYSEEENLRNIDVGKPDEFEITPMSAAMDIAKGVGVGALDAASSIANLGVSLTNLVTNYEFEKFDAAASLGWKTNTIAGNMVSTISQFFVPFAALGKVGRAAQLFSAARKGSKAAQAVGAAGRVLAPSNVKAIKKFKDLQATGQITKGTLWKARGLTAAKTTARGAVVDFAAFEANEARFADIANKVPVVGAIFDGLAYDEDDNAFVARMKNMADGALLGATADFMLGVFRSRKAMKIARAAGDSEEDVIAAGVEATLKHEDLVLREAAEADAAVAEQAKQTPMRAPAGVGTPENSAATRKAAEEIDEARNAGKVIGEDGSISDPPTEVAVDADGNLVELTPGESARLAEEGAPSTQAVGPDGETVDLTPAEAARLDEEGALPRTETRTPDAGEDVKIHVDPVNGQLEFEWSPARKVREIESIADEVVDDVVKAANRTGHFDTQAFAEAFDETARRQDLPLNPREIGPDGKPIELPEDLSRRAANIGARRAVLADLDGARVLTQTLETKYGQQNFGAVLDADELAADILRGADEFMDISEAQRADLASRLANASEEQLREGLVKMQVQGTLSTLYMNEVPRLIREVLQHEDTIANEKLLEIGRMVSTFNELQNGYRQSKSIFGFGLREPVSQVTDLNLGASKMALDVCGLKP